MQGKNSTNATRLVADYVSGRLTRREMIRKAVAAGVSVPAIAAILAGASPRRAFAQDATPIPDPDAASTLVVPSGLRTDLSGSSITAVLADPTDPNGPFLEGAIAKFTEATGIAVEFQRGERTADARLQAYRQQFAGQSADIDVYQIDVIWPGVVAEHAVNLAEPLADLAAQHFEAIVQNNTVEDVLVGIPWFTDAGLLYFRTDLLEKHGVTAPTTWDELTTSAQAIQDAERADNPDFYGYAFQGRAYEGLTCNGLEWQVSNGGGFIVESDGTVSINNPQAIEAFDRARSWVGTIAPEGVTTYAEQETLNLWTAGNLAFARNWPYMFAASQEAPAVAGKVDVSPLPMGTGDAARNADTLGGWQLMVSKYSENQEPAIEFIKFMCSPEFQTAFAAEQSMLPTIAAVYDAQEVAEASEFIPRLKDVFQGGAVARPSSVTGDLYPEVSQAYSQQLNQVLTGDKDGATAAADMEAEISAIAGG